MLLRAAARRCAARPYLTSATMGRRMGAAPTTWWPKLDCAIAARPTIVPPPLSTWDLLDLNFRPVVNEPLDFTPHPDLTLEFDLPASSDAPTDEIRSPEPTGEALQMMPKRTWQPKRLQRKRKHGFLKRMSTTAGRKILNKRRRKGRWRVSVT